MDIDSVRQYLAANSIPYTELTPLTVGGSANYIWRVTAPDGGTSIIKHASGHLRVNKAFLLSLDRMHYEVQALKLVPGLLAGSATEDLNVHLPAVLHYSAENHTIHISDGGSRNLFQAYTDPTVDVLAIGSRLGRWLARLHTVTSSAAVLPTIKAEFNHIAGKKLYRTSFNGLAAALAKAGYDPALGERINAKYGAMLDTDEVGLSHGDFWTANVIVGDAASGPPPLTVVDWEITRLGNPATDVGQFMAESWILDTFAETREGDGAPDWTGGRRLLGAFLKAYLAERKLSESDKIRVAAQFGTHMAYYPSIIRYPVDSRQPTEMARVGRDMLEMVDAGDLEELKGSTIKLLWES
jgi:hypothetical protein